MPNHHWSLDSTLVFLLCSDENGNYFLTCIQIAGRLHAAEQCILDTVPSDKRSHCLYSDIFHLWKKINPSADVVITTLHRLPSKELLHSLREASYASATVGIIFGDSEADLLQFQQTYSGTAIFSKCFLATAAQNPIFSGRLLPLNQRTYLTSSTVYIRSGLAEIAQGCQGLDTLCLCALRSGYSMGKAFVRGDEFKHAAVPLFAFFNIKKSFSVRVVQWMMFHQLVTQNREDEARILFAIYKVLRSAARCREGEHTFLFVAHSNYWENISGGTENHLRQLEESLAAQGHLILAIAPSHKKSVSLHISCTHCNYNVTVPGSMFYVMSNMVTQFADILHVHHTARWDESHINYLLKTARCTKVFTAHDFYALCPTVDLLSGPQRSDHCSGCIDLCVCNTCLAGIWKHAPASMSMYRARSAKFLSQFSRILFPSIFMSRYYTRCLPAAERHIMDVGKCFPHSLAYITDVLKPDVDRGGAHAPSLGVSRPIAAQTLGLIGNIRTHKGLDILREAAPRLAALGFRIIVFGALASNLDLVIDVQVYPFQGVQELHALFNTHGQPDFLCHLSLCAETFSFTFFEGLLLSPRSIPIVGPFGNPAEVCIDNKIGPVLSESSASAFLDALHDAQANAIAYRERLQQFVYSLCASTASDDYIGRYLALVAPPDASVQSEEHAGDVVFSMLQHVSDPLYYACMFSRRSFCQTLYALWGRWAKPLLFSRIAKRLCKWLVPC